jgi:acyl carrier protein
MSHTIKLTGSNKRFVARTFAGDYLVRKHNGSVATSKVEATAFSTYSGAEGLAYGIKTPIEILELEFDVVLRKSQPTGSIISAPKPDNTGFPFGTFSPQRSTIDDGPAVNRNDERQRRLHTVISEQLGVNLSDVALHTKFVEDLGADSLDEIELVMAVEDEFGIEITDEDAERCRCMQDVLNLLAHSNAR